MTIKNNKTRFLIQKNKYLKSRFWIARIGLSVISLIIAFYYSMIGGGFNIYYYFLDVMKIIFFYTICMALVYFIVADEEDYKNWNDHSYRKKSLKEKIILSLLEGGILFILLTAVLGILYLLKIPYSLELEFINIQSGNSLLTYTPNLIDGIILAPIMLMQLIAPLAGIYWQYSRCMTVIGFDKRKTALKIETNVLFFMPFVFVLIWATFPIFLDSIYFELLYPEVFTNATILQGSIFSSKPYLYLIIQLGVLSVLNLFFIIDGILANKYRKNFREVDIILENTSNEDLNIQKEF